MGEEGVDESSVTGLPRARVLLIDDELSILRSLGRVLSRVMDVEPVESAEVAEQLIASGRSYELIVCDLNLRGKNGVEFYRWLSRAQPALALRLVFLSGYGGDADLVVQCPEVPCLSKPIQVQELFDLANRSWESDFVAVHWLSQAQR